MRDGEVYPVSELDRYLPPTRVVAKRTRAQSDNIGGVGMRIRANDSLVEQDELTRYRMRRAMRAAEIRGHNVRGSLSSGPPDWAREFRARGEIRPPFAGWGKGNK
jgi:hypothetical protein